MQVEPDCHAECVQRAGEIAFRPQDVAERHLELQRIDAEFPRDLRVLHRLVELLEPKQRGGEVLMGVGIVGVQVDRVPVAQFRRRQPVEVVIRVAEEIVRIGQFGIEPIACRHACTTCPYSPCWLRRSPSQATPAHARDRSRSPARAVRPPCRTRSCAASPLPVRSARPRRPDRLPREHGRPHPADHLPRAASRSAPGARHGSPVAARWRDDRPPRHRRISPAHAAHCRDCSTHPRIAAGARPPWRSSPPPLRARPGPAARCRGCCTPARNRGAARSRARSSPSQPPARARRATRCRDCCAPPDSPAAAPPRAGSARLHRRAGRFRAACCPGY